MRVDNFDWFRGGAVALGLLVVLGLLPGVGGAQGLDEFAVEVEQGNRRLDVLWPAIPEVEDALFAGYSVWRSEIPDAVTFQLMRRFDRRYPVTWTFCDPATSTECDPVTASTQRTFVDPDSVVTLIKVEISAQGDSAMVRDYIGIQPHNGFPYYYAVTWYSECMSERNDTLVIDQPQPPIFEFQRGADTLHGFVSDGDTLLVTQVSCRQIDNQTNGPVGDPVTIYQGTAESDNALRLYAIEQLRTRTPVFPSTVSQPNLRNARPIPNPYEESAFWDVPGERKVQFINLTEQATVEIYTLGGDLVRKLGHPVPDAQTGQGSIDWNLKNAAGRLVAPGIYIYNIKAPGVVVEAQGRLILVF